VSCTHRKGRTLGDLMGMRGREGKRWGGGITLGLIPFTTLKVTLCAVTYAKIGTLAAFGTIMGPLLPLHPLGLTCPFTYKPNPPEYLPLDDPSMTLYRLHRKASAFLFVIIERTRSQSVVIPSIRIILIFICLGRPTVDPGLCSFRNKPSLLTAPATT